MDKERRTNSFIKGMYNRTLNMFHYTNAPFPYKELEKLLQKNGYALFIKQENEYYVTECGFSGEDVYKNPTHAIVSNPYLKNATYEIGIDCVLINNDDMQEGLDTLFHRYGEIISESEITMILSNYNSRIQTLISASDDLTKESAMKYLDDIIEGKLGIIGDSKLFDSLKVFNKSVSNISTSNIIELQQYLRATLYNEIGLNANYNMKRERLNTSEVEMNTDNLYPLVDNLFRNRKEAIEKINEIFGLKIEIEFTSIWKLKQLELEQTVENAIEDESENESEDESENESEDESENESEDESEDESENESEEKLEELEEEIEEVEEELEEVKEELEEGEES